MAGTKEITQADVVGVGLNATDTIIRLPYFPTLDSKVPIISSHLRAGGQVATAMVACQRWGLHARYVGKVGDDWAADFQQEQLDADGVESHVRREPHCPSPQSYILVDAKSGERTVLWSRDPRAELHPDEVQREWVQSAKILLVDGHDATAAAQAARWAREVDMPVVADVDNLYPGAKALLELVTHMIGSTAFPHRITSEPDLLKALPQIHAQFKYHLTAATLGKNGVIAWDGVRFLQVPGFVVEVVDTTGAGDVFHGAFVYGMAKGFPLERNLEFSCAAAALSCMAIGARAGISTLPAIEHLIGCGERHEPRFTPEELEKAARLS
jgi:sugar/nucleoside kinase (ribokinase family)